MAHEAASLGDFEHLAIKRALEISHGNLTQAARALGISRSTLHRKVQRYHLDAVIKPSPPGRESGALDAGASPYYTTKSKENGASAP
jgi:hypothetical protein